MDGGTEVGEDLFSVLVVDRDVERAGQRLAELLPLAVLAVEAAHLPQHGHVVRVELDDLRVVGLRVLGMTEVLAVPLGEAQAEADGYMSVT